MNTTPPTDRFTEPPGREMDEQTEAGEEPSAPPPRPRPPFVFSPIQPETQADGFPLAEPGEGREPPEGIPPTAPGTAPSLAALQEAVDRLTASLTSLEDRLASWPPEPPPPKEAAVEILVPQGGEAIEVPIKLLLETEDSRQLALLHELHAQRAQLQEELAEAHRQIERLGKTQFKSSNVMEALRKSADETVAELRAALEARDQELAELRNLAEEVRKEYRAHLARELLRIADGLERSQEEARHLEAALDREVEDQRPPGFWGRWRARRAQKAQDFLRERRGALASWQEGLGFVQQRLLALLAEAGVEPMQALGQPFNPHQHVAVGRRSDPAQPDNVVVEEHLRGYLMGDRVLRFAEVVVNKVPSEEDPTTQT